MIRALLLSLLDGVPVEDYEYECRMRDAERDFAHEDQLRACRYKSALCADLARVEQERDAERANANEWLAKCHDAEKRIAALEAKLAEATSGVALAERRYAQAWWDRNAPLIDEEDYGSRKRALRNAEEALRDAYAAAAKGEGGERER